MSKQKFKVGDRVRIIDCNIEELIGSTGTITEIDNDDIPFRVGLFWCRKVEHVRVKHPVIVITSDGTTTTATMRKGKKIIKTATAKCSEKDTFDFAEGARIAFERLQGRDPFEKKAEERPVLPEKLVCVSKPRVGAFAVGKVYKPTWITAHWFNIGLYTGRRIGNKYIVQFGVGDAEFIPFVED